MAKFVLLADDARASAFYDAAIHGAAIPSEAVAISDALWRSWIGQTADVVYVASTASLIPYVAPIVAPTQAQLVAYAKAKQAAIAAAGVSVNVAPAGDSPLMLFAKTDTDGKSNLSGLLQASSLNPSGLFDWQQGVTTIPLTQAQVQALAIGVYAFIQLTWTVRGKVLAAIVAGTITTFAQIDDPTTVNLPAWPANS